MSRVTDEKAKANIASNIQRLLGSRKPPENTQTWLARESKESDMRISLYSRGVKLASAGVLSRIAEAFDVSVDELLSDPPPQNGRGKKSSRIAASPVDKA